MNRRSSTTQQALSVDHDNSSKWSGCALRCFFGIFFLAGSAMLYFMAIQPLWLVYSSQSWNETPCTILSSEVETHHDSDGGGDTYSIEITYRYIVERRQYQSNRYQFMIGSSGGRSAKEEIVRAYPPGFETVCYVNPDAPEEAVIERGLTADMWWGLFALPFLAVGLGGLIFGSRFSYKQEQDPAATTAQSFAAATVRSSSFAEESPNDEDDGPVILNPESSPLGAFGCAFLAALFWNGITSVFVYQAYQSHQQGRPEWFLTIFLIPFVLIGLTIIVGVLYTFLAIFNPRPSLTLSRRGLPLGSTAKVSWRFSGNAGKLQNLKLTLKGVEKATYRRGTDTTTDQQTFCEQVVFDSPQAYEFASGEIEFTVPSDSMHTFTADNNEIVWTLHVAGDVPLWPDVDDTFPITVTPHEPTPY